MKKMVLPVIVAAAAYGVLSYHFILFDSSLKILRKTDLRIENTFVDARGIRKFEVVLKKDLIEAGIKDILTQVDETLQKSSSQ